MRSSLATRARLVLLLALLVVLSTGCGPKGPPTFDVAPVKGTVTMQGQPLADADVTFYFDGTPPQGYIGSTAKTDSAGKYELITNAQKGAPPGSYKVTVSRFVDKSGNVPKNDPEAGSDVEQMLQSGVLTQSVPPTFSDREQTQKTAEVVAGKENVVDITIE